MRTLLLLFITVCLTACAGTVTQSTPHTFRSGAVAADHYAASEVGAEILRRGGNAVDAAVATSFALSVVRPYSCGIGGGGFMVIHMADGSRPVALDYRETAPAAVGPEFFETLPARASTTGATAVGVPGTVAGLLHALENYGTLSRAEVLAPAIALAEEGFIVDEHYIDSTRELVRRFGQDTELQGRFAFVWQRFLREGEVAVGDRIVLPEQARALRLIAELGAEAFYTGPIAEAIIATIQGDGGVMLQADLGGYILRSRTPLTFTFGGRTFITMPPPSSGGIAMAQTAGILERIAGMPGEPVLPQTVMQAPATPGAAHLLVESFKHAFADRAEWLGDPDFVDIPVGRLLRSDYLEARAVTFDDSRTLEPEAYGTREGAPAAALPEAGGTSHLSVVDRWGNAVACTETINLTFGSLLAVEEFGFVLNNELDDFTTRRAQPNAFGLRQSDRNLPAPHKRPLSSMTPTIVLDRRGNVEIVAGASGGPRIITATMQAILHVMSGMSAVDAVAMPRLHHQWAPDVVRMEPGLAELPSLDAASDGAGGETLADALRALGHEVQITPALATVQLIARDPAGRGWTAASDPRKGGRPAGH